MLFNSFSYAIFLIVVFFLYWGLPNKYRPLVLLVCSYYFYLGFNPKCVFILLITTGLSYYAAIVIENEESHKRKKLYLLGICLVCLSTLIIFKYTSFLLESLFNVLSLFSLNVSQPVISIVLPVGISFYTFRIISYVSDVYNGREKAEHNFIIYATYVSFFPQLVAGPIERATNLIPQIKGNHEFDENKAIYGAKLMLWGYYKKIVIADNVAKYVDIVYSDLRNYSGFNLALIIFFFTIQIYCDFSGYSDIAIGTAKLLGIDLSRNFHSPYFAGSIKEFWSRWHISLSTWFRDYVYIPLGGNRCSKNRRDFNLLLTFLLSGLWHGASWTFVIWGGIHGIAQIIEKKIGRKIDAIRKTKLGNAICILLVFVFCNLAWVFFRAESISDALYVIIHSLDGILSPLTYFKTQLISESNFAIIMIEIVLLTVFDFFDNKSDAIKRFSNCSKIVQWGTLIILGIIVVYFSNRTVTDFVYSQF